MTNLPHAYPCAKLEKKMVSEKKGKRRKKQKHRQATIWTGPGKGWDESLFSAFSLSMA